MNILFQHEHIDRLPLVDGEIRNSASFVPAAHFDIGVLVVVWFRGSIKAIVAGQLAVYLRGPVVAWRVVRKGFVTGPGLGDGRSIVNPFVSFSFFIFL